jgi:hypothetical protein
MKRQLKWTVYGAVAVAFGAAAFAGGLAWAGGIPATGALTYSGTLEDATGAPFKAQSSDNVVVKFWNTGPTGGTTICETASSQPLVVDSRGRFRVTLPDACTAAVKANANVWTEVVVDGSSLGRAAAGAVPYAVEAAHATAADSAATASGGLVQQVVPSGAVMAFNLGACPAGWTALAAAGGRAIVGVNPQGGNGLSERKLNASGGEEQHKLSVAELPAHTHTFAIFSAVGGFTQSDPNLKPQGGSLGGAVVGTSQPTDPTGGGTAFNNMQPWLALLYCQKD